MALTLPELKQRLADKYSAEELIEVLKLPEIETTVLVEVLADYIEENYEQLVQEVGDDEFSSYTTEDQAG